MKKILILANNDVGLYKFRKELIQELVKNYEVYISLPKGDFLEQLIQLGCKFIDTPINRRGTNPVADCILLIKYMLIMRRIKPSLVLTYTIKPNVYGGIVARTFSIPYIANITGLGSAVEGNNLLQRLTLFLYRISLKSSECVFFQNNENRQFFLDKNIKMKRDKLIPGSGVNLDYYQKLDYPPDGVIHFLFISRIMKEKGIDQYLDAAEYIKKKYVNTQFHILGFCEDDYEEKLKTMQEQKIIHYHGMQRDVRKFHEISHCTIHPTFYPEGMSNVLLESAACGRPIITTDRSGCKEIVDNGVNGYIIKQKNSEDLIKKVEKFLKLDYEQKKDMGVAGRVKVEKEFSRRIVVTAYMAEINKIL